MGLNIAKLISQCFSAAYAPLRDTVSYLNDKEEYVRDLNSNLPNLTAEVATISSRKKQIDRVLETSISKEKTDEYHILLKQIEVFSKKCNKFINRYHKDCKNLPNLTPEIEPDVPTASRVIDAHQESKPTIFTCKFFKLAKLSREINKLYDPISRIIDRVKAENLMVEKKTEVVQEKSDGDIDLPPLHQYVNKVLKYSHEDDNRSIGIVGLIGVGKTTVMKKLNNQLKNSSLELDVVIWINHPSEMDTDAKIFEMMQDVILTRLQLNQENPNSTEQNADIISEALHRKKYTVLIDQVTSTIKLNEVGIHRNHKFGKVVVASSNNRVINKMTDEHVEVYPLSKKDALDLLRKFCGMIRVTRIKDIADKIIESCGGLLLVIKLVAEYLKRNKDMKDREFKEIIQKY